ncbi:MAG: cysteine--tRNA ligase [Rhodobacteraceae bacterium]|nr:cysteine--tRNA ligase [Paracoccaceae bacterium]
MTEIRLYNTKTRTKELFTPLDARNVRMYVCGPTVYDRAHIGNARPVIVFDVLYRLLRHVYGADHVTYARNFTDVDDKINTRAAESGRSIREITDQTIGWYLEDMKALGNLKPDLAPRATEYIVEMVEMTKELIASGHAYEAEGHVLFDVTSYDRYGSLSGRSIDDMIAGARVEVAPYKRNPMDFVLWKPSDKDQPGWDSPWGRGRPGWHIECSAMTRALFGERFDIHGGGLDLAFPHHENEKAQSCCEAGEDSFAQVWMHNEMLQVEGKKMSKSLGNFFSVRELLDQGYPGEVIRFVFLSTHYRKPMDWTEKKAREARNTLRKWAEVADETGMGTPNAEVVEALADDLNTWAAIDKLHELFGKDDRSSLTASAHLLGIDLNSIALCEWAKPFHYEMVDGSFLKEGVDYQPTVGVLGWGPISEKLRDAALGVVRKWLSLRRNKAWEDADRLKEKAAEMGIELRASKSSNGINNGTASLDNDGICPAKLEALK